MHKYLIALFMLTGFNTYAQNCNCEKEFLYIKGFMEQNYPGFKDKQAQMTKEKYQKMVNDIQALTKTAKENCILFISQYLDKFKDQHIQVGAQFGIKNDTDYISQRKPLTLSPEKLDSLSRSTGIEGIYVFNFDSSYRIAVIKDKTPIHDYLGVIISSKLPLWRPGLIKFEIKYVNDSLLKGILYVRNQMPKVDWFPVGKNSLGGDWQREGTKKEMSPYKYVPVASEKLSDNILYIKISNFSPSNAANIDSIFKTHKQDLATMPYLVLDVRDNTGGADFTFSPILPYIYTSPVKGIGVDVLATKDNIANWKKLLDDKELPEENRNTINGMIEQMEANKDKMVSIASDYIDSTYTPLANPKRVVILMNRGSASTTEQFLLYARQSAKVILMGENTQGTLDYSNMREAAFSCMPYVLHYATTRSRRLDIGQGIDNIGIKPKLYLKNDADWKNEVIKVLTK